MSVARPAVLDTVSRPGRLLLAFPVACALFDVGLEFYLSTYGMFDPGYWTGLSAADVADLLGQAVFGLVALAWTLAAPLALTVLVVVGLRRFPRGVAVVAAACATFTVATFGALISMLFDDSSTAVLLLLFLPFYLIVMLVPFAAATVVTHRLRTHRAERTTRDWLASR